MKTLAEWTLQEYMGRDWAEQVVWRDGLESLPAGPLAVVDETGALYPAQKQGAGRVYYPMQLSAGAIHHLRLVQAKVNSALTWSKRAPGLGNACRSGAAAGWPARTRRHLLRWFGMGGHML